MGWHCRYFEDVAEAVVAKARGHEVVGKIFGASRFQLLDERLDVDGMVSLLACGFTVRTAQ